MQHHCDLSAQRFEVIFTHIVPANLHAAAGHVIQARDQLHKRAFRAARAADNANRFALPDGQADIVQAFLLGVVGVAEIDVVKCDRAVRDLRQRLRPVDDAAFFLEHFHHSLGGRAAHGQHDEDHGNHHQAHQDLHGIGKHGHQLSGQHLAGDDGLCAEPGQAEHAAVHAKLHQRGVKRQNTLSGFGVAENLAGRMAEFIGFTRLAHVGFYDAHRGHVLLYDAVEAVVAVEHFLEIREREMDNGGEPQVPAQRRGRPLQACC